MRSKAQWLEMIRRTRPSAFAVNALQVQLAREAGNFDAGELEALRDALAGLAAQVKAEASEVQARTPEARATLSLEHRREGMGGRGRIYAEIEGRPLRDLLDHPVLDEAQVYIFMDSGRVAGFQVDNANTLAERLEPVLVALETLELEHVDWPERGLSDLSLSEVLRRAIEG